MPAAASSSSSSAIGFTPRWRAQAGMDGDVLFVHPARVHPRRAVGGVAGGGPEPGLGGEPAGLRAPLGGAVGRLLEYVTAGTPSTARGHGALLSPSIRRRRSCPRRLPWPCP